ncbi:MAG: TetR family transcriptional regulator [Corynebacterium sp.]|nr:TetR family transcriptional regulator [Corynebacterium sp.]
MANSQESAPKGRPRGRRRKNDDSLSEENILAAAIAILDAEGLEGLTIRRLAQELHCAVASIYWYVKNKDELLQFVSSEILRRLFEEYDGYRSKGVYIPERFAHHNFRQFSDSTPEVAREALSEIRLLLLCLFTKMLDHRWLALQFLNSGPGADEGFDYWERIGQAVSKLGLDQKTQFYVTMAIVNCASGLGVEISSHVGHKNIDPADWSSIREEQQQAWQQLDAERFPFFTAGFGQFLSFDPEEFINSEVNSFALGIDLLLSGLEQFAR